MAHSTHDRFENLSSETAEHIISNAFTTRMKTIELLRQYAREADSIHQGCAESNRDANVTGAIGGAFGTALGGLTIATGGLAAPMVLSALALGGFACSVGGGVWCVKNECNKLNLNNNLEEKILQLLNEDDHEVKKMESIFRTLEGYFRKSGRKLVFRASHTSLAGGVAMIDGSETAFEIFSLGMPKIALFFSEKKNSVLFSMLEHSSLIEGVEVVAENDVSKDFVKQDAPKTYEKVLENAAGKAPNKAAKEGGNIAAQHAARQTAKKATAKAAKATATKAAEATAKTAIEASAKIIAVEVSAKKAVEVSTKKAVEVSAKKTVEVSAKKAVVVSAKKAVEVTGKKAVEVTGKKAVEVSAKKAVEVSAKKAVEVTGKKAVEVTGKKAVEVSAKKAVEVSAKKAVEVTGKKAVEVTGKKAVEVSAKKTVEVSTKKTVELSAKKTVEVSTKKAVEVSTKTVAKVTGSVTAGFGVLTSVWEGYNAYQNHCEAQKESQLGRELRELANRMEKALNKIRYLQTEFSLSECRI